MMVQYKTCVFDHLVATQPPLCNHFLQLLFAQGIAIAEIMPPLRRSAIGRVDGVTLEGLRYMKNL